MERRPRLRGAATRGLGRELGEPCNSPPCPSPQPALCHAAAGLPAAGSGHGQAAAAPPAHAATDLPAPVMVSAFGAFSAAPVAPLPATAISSLTLELKVGGPKVGGGAQGRWVVGRARKPAGCAVLGFVAWSKQRGARHPAH